MFFFRRKKELKNSSNPEDVYKKYSGKWVSQKEYEVIQKALLNDPRLSEEYKRYELSSLHNPPSEEPDTLEKCKQLLREDKTDKAMEMAKKRLE